MPGRGPVPVRAPVRHPGTARAKQEQARRCRGDRPEHSRGRTYSLGFPPSRGDRGPWGSRDLGHCPGDSRGWCTRHRHPPKGAGPTGARDWHGRTEIVRWDRHSGRRCPWEKDPPLGNKRGKNPRSSPLSPGGCSKVPGLHSSTNRQGRATQGAIDCATLRATEMDAPKVAH